MSLASREVWVLKDLLIHQQYIHSSGKALPYPEQSQDFLVVSHRQTTSN